MFWNIFYELCNKASKSPNSVAAEIGVSNATCTKWKKGAMPGSEVLIKIADYFNVSIDSLLGRKTPGEPKNDLTSSESDMLSLFRQLPEKEQYKELGRLEMLISANTDFEIAAEISSLDNFSRITKSPAKVKANKS